MNKIWISSYIKDLSIEHSILSHYSIEQNKNNLEDCIGAIIWHEKFPSDFSNFELVKAISRFGAGVDNIDLKFCYKNNIRVSNVADYGIDEVSDTALAFLLWAARGIGRYNYLGLNLQDGSWESNIQTEIERISSNKLGIVGLGRIGGKLAMKAKAIGFNVLAFDPYQIAGYEKVIGVERVKSLQSLLNQSDYVSLNCDLNNSSRSLVDKNFLDAMKPRSSLINTARGAIIDSIDVILNYLESGHLRSFATDVLPEEPPSKKIQNRIKNSLKLQNQVLITPHTAFYSKDSYIEMRYKAANNLLDLLTDDELLPEEKSLKYNFLFDKSSNTNL